MILKQLKRMHKNKRIEMILKQLKRMHKNYNLLLLKNKNKYNNYYKKWKT